MTEPMTVAELEALLEGTSRAPWAIEGDGEMLMDAYRGNIIAMLGDYGDDPEQVANAALLAAAPDLAAALVAALGERDEAIRLLRGEWAQTHLPLPLKPSCCSTCAFLAAHPVAPLSPTEERQ